MHNLKIENYVLFGKLAEDLRLGGRASKSHCEGFRGSQDIKQFLQDKNRWSERQKIIVN